MSAFDEIVKQGVARLSPATMAAIRQHVDRIEEQRVAPAPVSAPLFGIRLVVDRDAPEGWLMADRPSTVDGLAVPIDRFLDEWRRWNGLVEVPR